MVCHLLPSVFARGGRDVPHPSEGSTLDLRPVPKPSRGTGSGIPGSQGQFGSSVGCPNYSAIPWFSLRGRGIKTTGVAAQALPGEELWANGTANRCAFIVHGQRYKWFEDLCAIVGGFVVVCSSCCYCCCCCCCCCFVCFQHNEYGLVLPFCCITSFM